MMKKQFEIFYRFLLLGLISFGGPIAHLGYFRKAFVEKLQWLNDESYSKIVALSQFLPGPSSSQVGFTIGLKRGGIVGAILAFLGFTLPSFFLLYFLAVSSLETTNSPLINGIISGLKLFAVVVVADATYGMFQNFCKTKFTLGIFIIGSFILLVFQGFFIQILVIFFAGVIGALLFKSKGIVEKNIYEKPKLFPLVLFFIPLIIALVYPQKDELVSLFLSFYEVGSLVFGGGHVVLPLISQNVAVDENSFLVGYALAQAVPGPMFSIASYLGASGVGETPLLGAIVATIAIFLPGFLLILAFEKSFESYSQKPKIGSAIIAINASVVAILFAALCNPIFLSGVNSILDFLVALLGFFLLRRFKISILYFIIGFCLFGIFNGY